MNQAAYAAACSRNGGIAATASTSPPPAVRTATSLAAPVLAAAALAALALPPPSAPPADPNLPLPPRTMRLRALRRAAGRDLSLAVAADHNHVVAVAQAGGHARARYQSDLPYSTTTHPRVHSSHSTN